jgi:soluble lytic murein transglycosylase
MKNIITTIILILVTTSVFSKTVNLEKLTSMEFSKSCEISKIISALPQSLEDRILNVNKAVNSIALSIPVNPCLILSITWAETNFKASQRSKKKAHGLMQVLPSTRKEVAKKMGYELNRLITLNLGTNLHGQELEDIAVGSYYMHYLITKFKFNEDHAIMAYNMGPKWLNNRINKKLAYGTNNKYLNKVKSNFATIAMK